MIVEIDHTVPSDADEIFENLRDADKYGIELLQVDGLTSLKAEIARATTCYTGRVDGEIVMIWGIACPTLLSGEGFVWMITSNAADKVPFIFARRSQRELDAVLDRIPKLAGACFAYNKRSLRWLKWLGAEIGNITHVKGIACYPFVFRRV